MLNSLVVSESATNQVLGSMESLFTDYGDKLGSIKRIAAFAKGKEDLISYFTNGSAHRLMAEKIFELEPAKAALDAEFWSKAMNMTDVLDYMSAEKRNEWNKNIHDRKCPNFERDAVITTIRNLLLSWGSFIAEKVDGIFRKLSGEHVTNSPLGFGKRMIISYVLDRFGYINYERAEYLSDLRSVIAKLQNRNEPKSKDTQSDLRRIAQGKQFGEWHEFDGGAFKVRLYKAGTAHLEIHTEIAGRLNLILASLYPQALASSARKSSRKEKEIPLINTILPYEVTEYLSTVAESVSRGRDSYLNQKEIDKKIYEQLIEVLKFLGGKEDANVWSFSYDVEKVLHKIIRTGCLPEKKSHQFYPTQQSLASRVVEMINPCESDKILEPSAGHGSIAELLPKAATICIEISDLNSEILRQKGFNVITANFLKWSPRQQFNKIVMNPPFAKGEAERHVKKASEILTPDGILVAILPSSLRNKTIVKGMTHVWSETIQDAFEDTTASVVILQLTHEDAKT